MQLTAVFLLGVCLQVTANVASQTVTIDVKKTSLEKVFTEVEKQTGYVIISNAEHLSLASPITISAKDEKLSAFFERLLKDQPLTYVINKTTIGIRKKEVHAALPIEKEEPPVTGVVRGPDGQPIAGVNVVVKGTKKGVVTDAYGRFSIEAEQGKTLVVSNVGYNAKEIKVNGENNIIVGLEISTSKLDEVQIVAYGKNTQRFQTGNVASVKAEDIERQPVNNPLLALQGRVAGLFITQNNGLPGSGVKVRIQGQNSIRNGSDPLYVINGVPYTSEIPPGIPLGPLGNSGGMANGFSTGTGNALNYISPSDIESIEVLKDADATAIYGSRAANGAILITTKKGKQGKATLDLNLQTGWGGVTRRLEMLNTPQYLEMRREAFANDGILPQIDNPFGEGYAPDLLLWDTTKNTDWQEKLLGNVARFTNLNASLSGGNSYLQYLVRATYQRETTVLLGNFEDQRGSLSFSITNTSIDRKFNFQLSGSYLADNNKLPTLDITSITIPLAPNSPDLQKLDGTLNWMENALGASTWGNPLARLYNTYQNKSRNALANMVVSYQILPGLDFRSSLGYNEISSDELQLNPLVAVRPERRAFTPRFAIYGNKNINTWIIEPQLTWKTKIAKGNLEVLLGSTTQQNGTYGRILSGSGHNSDLLLNDINSAPSISSVASLIANYKYAAIFSRINYNWQDKYLVNLSARRDGSSRFGPQNQFNNFGAIGGAWIFSEERLIKETIRFLSYGKLRGSYGITGSDQIGDYSYLNLYSPVTVEVPYQESLGLNPTSLPNPYLEWEETKKFQLGLDLGFFKDRILFTSTYVLNRSSNQLLDYALPLTTGFAGVYQNFPATIQNASWEFMLNTINVKNTDLRWSSALNVTIQHNKLAAFPDLASSTYTNELIVGYPLSIQKQYHFLGVDPNTGDYIVADADGKPTVSPNFLTDRTVLINPLPSFYGGIQNNISYKGVQIDFLFQFVKQLGPTTFFNNGTGLLPGQFVAAGGSNHPTSVLSRWQKPGDNASIQRYSTNLSMPGIALSSDANFADASFIRLKNISISSKMPGKWIRMTRLQNCRLYVHAQNLLTITKYKGLDPENLSPKSLPPLKMLTAGLQLTL